MTQWREPVGKVCKVLLAGDVSPNNANIGEILDIGPERIFGEVKPYFDAADLAVVQWEVPLASPELCAPIAKSGPNLICDGRGAKLIEFLGARAALLANNHIGDEGGAVTLETIRILEAAGARCVGAGGDLAAAKRPLCVELNGVKLAIINAAEHEFGTATRHAPGSAPLEPEEIMETIRELRGSGHRVLVALHGGHEYDPHPSPRMMKMFRMFVAGGADAVFNCHTHCPEGVEIRHGAPIVCSPGNFYFPVFREESRPLPTWSMGYLTRIGFDAAGAFSLELIPYTFTMERVTVLAGAATERFMEYLRRISEPLADMAELERLFDLWTTVHGFKYVRGALRRILDAGFDFSDAAAARKYLPLRNTYTCEAHRDMVGNFFRLVEQGRVPAEPVLAEEIARLQQGPQLS
ncbi:MAG: CapA family protein [Lentisphaeria bacterium]|nr:CapA family protein [Lentisphaeria bacterium]